MEQEQQYEHVSEQDVRDKKAVSDGVQKKVTNA